MRKKTPMTRASRTHGPDSADLLAELDHLNGLLLECRAVFPTMDVDMIGQREFSTAPYYQRRGYRAQIRLEQPISADFIARQRQLGRWINENALIRLYGILNYRGLFKELKKALPGYLEMDVLRRIRNVLTKTSLDYRPDDAENRRLREAVIRHFDLGERDIQEQIPIPINKVVDPIFEGCRKYILAFENAHNNRMEPTRD